MLLCLYSTWSTGIVVLLIAQCKIFPPTDATNATEESSCAILYTKGVEAYLENRFEDCVVHLEAAIQIYRIYIKKLQNCRITCTEEAEQSDPLYSIDVENLRFYEKAIRNTLCLVKCGKKDNVFTSQLNRETIQVFENRKPYEYLHICYYQVSVSTWSTLLISFVNLYCVGVKKERFYNYLRVGFAVVYKII